MSFYQRHFGGIPPWKVANLAATYYLLGDQTVKRNKQYWKEYQTDPRHIMPPVPRMRKRKRSNGQSYASIYHKRAKLYGTSSARSNGRAGVVTNNIMGAVGFGKKKFNRKSYKKWKRFRGKVLKATEKQEAPKNQVFNNKLTVLSAANVQNYFVLNLNSVNGDTTQPAGHLLNDGRDMLNVFSHEVSPATSAAVPGGRIKVVHSYLDCEITNVPYGVGEDSFPANPVVLDVYTIVCKKDEARSLTATMPDTAAKAYVNGFNDATNPLSVQGTGQTLDPSDIGASPFESHMFTKRWNVLGKRRILLNPNSSISLNLSSKKTWFLDNDTSLNKSVVRGRTKALLFVWSSCINTNTATNVAENPACALAFESNRTYKYRHVLDSVSGSNYNT